MNDRVIGDIEVLKACFLCVLVDYNTGDTLEIMEISERRNDLQKIYTFFTKKREKEWFFVTFNGVHYDGVVINYLLSNYRKLKYMLPLEITRTLREFSDVVIRDEPQDFETYRWYRFQSKKHVLTPYTPVDLFLYWSKMLRISKRLSLKSIGCNLGWKKLETMPVDQTKDSYSNEELDLIISYCLNDCGITRALAQELKDKINLRIGIRKQYGLNCLSWDDVKIGLNILGTIHENRIGNDAFKMKKTYRNDGIYLKDIILPFINFNPNKDKLTKDKHGTEITNSFYPVYQALLQKKVYPYSLSAINYEIRYDNQLYQLKAGGMNMRPPFK